MGNATAKIFVKELPGVGMDVDNLTYMPKGKKNSFTENQCFWNRPEFYLNYDLSARQISNSSCRSAIIDAAIPAIIAQKADVMPNTEKGVAATAMAASAPNFSFPPNAV